MMAEPSPQGVWRVAIESMLAALGVCRPLLSRRAEQLTAKFINVENALLDDAGPRNRAIAVSTVQRPSISRSNSVVIGDAAIPMEHADAVSQKRKRLSFSGGSDSSLKIQRLSNDFRKRVTVSADTDVEDMRASSMATDASEADGDSPGEEPEPRKRRYFRLSPQSSRAPSVDLSPISASAHDKTVFTGGFSATFSDPFSFPHQLLSEHRPQSWTSGGGALVFSSRDGPPSRVAELAFSGPHITPGDWMAHQARLKNMLPDAYAHALQRYTQQLEYHISLLQQARRSPHAGNDEDYMALRVTVERIIEAVEWVQSNAAGERVTTLQEAFSNIPSWGALWTSEVETVVEFVQITEDMRAVGSEVGAHDLDFCWFRRYLDEKRHLYGDALRNDGLEWRSQMLPVNSHALQNCRSWFLHRMLATLEAVHVAGQSYLPQSQLSDPDITMRDPSNSQEQRTRPNDDILTHMDSIAKVALLMHDTVYFTGGVPAAAFSDTQHRSSSAFLSPDAAEQQHQQRLVAYSPFVQQLFTVVVALVSQYAVLLSQQSDHLLSVTRGHGAMRVVQFKLIKCFQTLVKLVNCLSTVRSWIFHHYHHHHHPATTHLHSPLAPALTAASHELLSSSLVEAFLRHCAFLAKLPDQQETAVGFSVGMGSGVASYQHSVMAVCATALLKACLRWAHVHEDALLQRIKSLEQLSEGSEHLLLEF
ncbi:hypothetical protein RI367_002750 [Sorochytrium milnesiophthora]